MSKYKVLLFDMDGTIANTDKLVIHSWQSLYEVVEPQIRRSPKELLKFSGPPGEESLAKEYPDYDLAKICGIYRDIEKSCYDTDVTNYPDCIDTIKALKALGYRVACVTNKPRIMSLKTFEVLGMEGLFDSLVCAGDNGILAKPNPSAVNKALEELGATNKEEVIYIGDNKYDYETAKQSNIDCMLVSWGPRQVSEDIKPNYYVHSFKELFEVIKNGR